MNRQEVLEMYKDLRVADVRDGMDWCGYHHYGSVHHSIRPLWRTRTMGFARTARYLPYEGPVPMVIGDEYTKWARWHYENVVTDDWVADILLGDFICLETSGCDVGLLGSCNTLTCMNKGATGFLLNGSARDTDELILQKIPVYLQAISQNMSQARMRYYEKDIPIGIGGVAIYPNDFVVADGDGVIVVPNKMIYEVHKYAYQEMKGDRYARRDLYKQGDRDLDETVDTSILT
jgi:regulator of RNase E activity RraA